MEDQVQGIMFESWIQLCLKLPLQETVKYSGCEYSVWEKIAWVQILALLLGLNKIINVTCSEQSLANNKPSINISHYYAANFSITSISKLAFGRKPFPLIQICTFQLDLHFSNLLENFFGHKVTSISVLCNHLKPLLLWIQLISLVFLMFPGK